MNVRENLTISDVARHFRGGRLRQRGEVDETQQWIDRLVDQDLGEPRR